MASTYYTASSDRRRATAMVLTVLAHLLLLWLLLRIAPRLTSPPAENGALSTFDVSANPTASVAGSRAPTASRAPRSGGAPPRSAARAPQPATPPAASPPPPPLRSPSEAPPIMLPGLLPGGEALFAASGRAMSTRNADAGSGAGEGRGSAMGRDSDSGSVAGPGEGPGGQRLYDAELVRALPPGALAAYMPGGKLVAGWGMIACRMTKTYEVENCRVLSESPMGSGFGSALRQASWQFRIRPPRIGSQTVKGVWVRIRYEFTFTESR